MSKLTAVMYHYVRDVQNSRFPEIKALDIDLFVEQVEYLTDRYTIISMEEAINCIDNRSTLPDKAAVLTFDDGYLDHYTSVLPVLSSFNVQGSFYIPARTTLESKVLDVNKIHLILASVFDKGRIIQDIKSQLSIYSEQFDLLPFEDYYAKFAVANRFDSADVIFIKRVLQVGLDEEVRMKIVDFLFNKYLGVDERVIAHELYMTEQQLTHMVGCGMHIGCHGYNHYWWNHLSQIELEEEISKSKVFLRKIGVDMDFWTACYPYGSYSDDAAELLKREGCRLAFTTEVDVISTPVANKFSLPRLDTNDLLNLNGQTSRQKWYNRG